MGSKTKISWCDSTWSCFRGCSRTIAAGATQSGCGDPSGGGCYAERNGYRFAGPGLPYEGLVRMTPNGARWTGKVLLIDEHLLDPIRWARPRRIFTTSVSDPFHERFTNETIAIVFGVMAVTPRHTHQCLTKRIGRARAWFAWVAREAAAANGGRGMSPAAFCFSLLQRYVADRQRFSDAERKLVARGAIVEAAISATWPLPSVWLGVSVENQAAADERIPELLATPAAVHWISAEPLLGEVDVSRWIRVNNSARKDSLGWLVCGCESGPGARPCLVQWLRSLRDQCAAAGVPFWLKQAHEEIERNGEDRAQVTTGPGSKRKAGGVIELPYLDGVQHAALPEATS